MKVLLIAKSSIFTSAERSLIRVLNRNVELLDSTAEGFLLEVLEKGYDHIILLKKGDFYQGEYSGVLKGVDPQNAYDEVVSRIYQKVKKIIVVCSNSVVSKERNNFLRDLGEKVLVVHSVVSPGFENVVVNFFGGGYE